MRGIVQAKPFVKKKVRYGSSNKSISFLHTKKSKKRIYTLSKYRRLLLVVLLLGSFFIYSIRSLYYDDRYLIKTIHYDPEIQQYFNSTELLVKTSQMLRDSFFHPFSQTSKTLAHIQEDYPFISDISIEFVGQNEVLVKLLFLEPEFVVQLGGIRYGIWKGGFSQELYSGSKLGLDAFLIDTPKYSENVFSLKGFFYAVSYQWYLDNITLIQATFPNLERFVYLVGSNNFVVFENNQMIFFSKDYLGQQFSKLHRLQSYYPGYNTLYKIDLLSFMDNKVVIQ